QADGVGDGARVRGGRERDGKTGRGDVRAVAEVRAHVRRVRRGAVHVADVGQQAERGGERVGLGGRLEQRGDGEVAARVDGRAAGRAALDGTDERVHVAVVGRVDVGLGAARELDPDVEARRRDGVVRMRVDVHDAGAHVRAVTDERLRRRRDLAV